MDEKCNPKVNSELTLSVNTCMTLLQPLSSIPILEFVCECGVCIRGGSVDSFLSQSDSQRAVRTHYTLSYPALPTHDATRCLSAPGLSQQHARGTRRCARSETASFRVL